MIVDYLTVNFFELSNPVREGNDLSGADECEVKGIEVDHHIFTLINTLLSSLFNLNIQEPDNQLEKLP